MNRSENHLTVGICLADHVTSGYYIGSSSHGFSFHSEKGRIMFDGTKTEIKDEKKRCSFKQGNVVKVLFN